MLLATITLLNGFSFKLAIRNTSVLSFVEHNTILHHTYISLHIFAQVNPSLQLNARRSSRLSGWEIVVSIQSQSFASGIIYHPSLFSSNTGPTVFSFIILSDPTFPVCVAICCSHLIPTVHRQGECLISDQISALSAYSCYIHA